MHFDGTVTDQSSTGSLLQKQAPPFFQGFANFTHAMREPVLAYKKDCLLNFANLRPREFGSPMCFLKMQKECLSEFCNISSVVVEVGQIYAITGGSSTKIQGKQNKLFASAQFPHPVPDFFFGARLLLVLNSAGAKWKMRTTHRYVWVSASSWNNPLSSILSGKYHRYVSVSANSWNNPLYGVLGRVYHWRLEKNWRVVTLTPWFDDFAAAVVIPTNRPNKWNVKNHLNCYGLSICCTKFWGLIDVSKVLRIDEQMFQNRHGRIMPALDIHMIESLSR